MSARPRVSAIVPAPQLTAHGRRCLAQLLALDDVEVIFIPDRPPAEELDPRVVCEPSGAVSLGAKRQLGVERAQGEFVALIDDDAYPHPSWLGNAVAAFDADPGVGAVAGPTLTPPDDPELAQLGGRVYATPLVAGPTLHRYAPRAARDLEEAPGVNLLLRRADALAIGLVTPYYPGDDTVIAQRLAARGRRIRYVPGAIVYHSRRPLWRPHLLQVWRYSRHRGSFARLGDASSRRAGYFAPSALVLGLLGGALLPRRLRRLRALWRAGATTYALACVASGVSRRPSRWWRLSGGIAATHGTYGVGFLLGLLGVRLAEERGDRAPFEHRDRGHAEVHADDRVA